MRYKTSLQIILISIPLIIIFSTAFVKEYEREKIREKINDNSIIECAKRGGIPILSTWKEGKLINCIIE